MPHPLRTHRHPLDRTDRNVRSLQERLDAACRVLARGAALAPAEAPAAASPADPLARVDGPVTD